MKAIRIDREEVALARAAHACLELTKKETGQAMTVESLLPIVSPQNFAGQSQKCLLCHHFLPGGELVNKVGTTAEEIEEATKVIVASLSPLAEQGFWETGKPNVFAYLASWAVQMMDTGTWYE